MYSSKKKAHLHFLREPLDESEKESENVGLKLNIQKTKIMLALCSYFYLLLYQEDILLAL